MSSDSIIAGVLRKLAQADQAAPPPPPKVVPPQPAQATAPQPATAITRNAPQVANNPNEDESRDTDLAGARSRDFWTLPGFCWNARITTSFGDLPIQALRVRDPVRTSSGGFVQIKWTDEIKLDDGFLDGFPDAHPITISAGALGNGLPKNDITLSPHQRVSLSDGAFRSEFRMARDLLGRPGIVRHPQVPLRYFMFHCGEPAQVMIEGVWVSVAP